MRMKNRRTTPTDREPYFTLYEQYAQTSRTWLVAYGIGGPVLFLTREDVSRQITESGQGALIAWCFIIGAFLQVLIALINKWSNWLLFDSEEGGKAHSLAVEISNQYWLDVLCDAGAVVLFGVATVKTLLIMSS